MKIIEINEQVPWDLFLLADPSIDRIQMYIEDSLVYVTEIEGKIAGGFILQPLSDDHYELMNIAVSEDFQRQGIGFKLLNHVFELVRTWGGKSIELGTGTFGYQLAFYQRAGFRAARVDQDFFLLNYPEPIFEDGIQHKDMLRLIIRF